MTRAEVFELWRPIFRRMRTLAVLIALLGVLLGLVAGRTARIVIWIAAEFLAAWLFLTAFLQDKRYQRILGQLQPMESPVMTPSESEPLGTSVAGVQEDTPPTLALTEPLLLRDNAWQARRNAALRRFAHSFAIGALVCVGIAVVATGTGFWLSGTVRAAVIGCFGGGGAWGAIMCLIIRNKILKQETDGLK
jgi:hypothetical protein